MIVANFKNVAWFCSCAVPGLGRVGCDSALIGESINSTQSVPIWSLLKHIEVPRIYGRSHKEQSREEEGAPVQALIWSWVNQECLPCLDWESVHACVLSPFSCVLLCDPVDCNPPGSSVRGDSPGKNAGVGCHALLQGIFPTLGSNPCLLHWQLVSLPLAPPGNRKSQASYCECS